jgi:hypothetical protein
MGVVLPKPGSNLILKSSARAGLRLCNGIIPRPLDIAELLMLLLNILSSSELSDICLMLWEPMEDDSGIRPEMERWSGFVPPAVIKNVSIIQENKLSRNL